MLLCPDLSRAGGEAVVCSLGVSGGSTLRWQQSSGAGVDSGATAHRVSACLSQYQRKHAGKHAVNTH